MNFKIISETMHYIMCMVDGEHQEYRIEEKNDWSILISVNTLDSQCQYGIIILGEKPVLYRDPYSLQHWNDEVKKEFANLRIKEMNDENFLYGYMRNKIRDADSRLYKEW